jgi:2-polyprenyl-6-hydroxyphenyl methylase/3-demethylubiquinone-9 3-methyltransferase
VINNEFYKDLGEAWFTAEGDHIALLRLENECKAPWVLHQIAGAGRVLDVGCGGGFLALQMAAEGHSVTALDVDESVFAAARSRASELTIDWVSGRAEALPFADESFDAVCVMDVLEHVNEPEVVVAEAARVLRPGGKLLVHTFNRTFWAWLLADRGMQWFVPGAQDVHDWHYFIRPQEIEFWLRMLGFKEILFTGIRPELPSILRLLVQRRVPEDFAFKVSKGLRVGYLGSAVK